MNAATLSPEERAIERGLAHAAPDAEELALALDEAAAGYSNGAVILAHTMLLSLALTDMPDCAREPMRNWVIDAITLSTDPSDA